MRLYGGADPLLVMLRIHQPGAGAMSFRGLLADGRRMITISRHVGLAQEDRNGNFWICEMRSSEDVHITAMIPIEILK